LVSHLIGNRASFLCTKAPMPRVPGRTFWMAWAVDYQEFIGASPPAEQWPNLNQYPRSSDRQACRATIKSTHFAVRPGPKISDGDTYAPSAQHAAGNLDNRHVGIVCAASAHVNASLLYQFVDTAKRPWPTSVAPRRVSSGRVARGPVAP